MLRIQQALPERYTTATEHELADMIGASIGVALHALLVRVITPRALQAR